MSGPTRTSNIEADSHYRDHRTLCTEEEGCLQCIGQSEKWLAIANISATVLRAQEVKKETFDTSTGCPDATLGMLQSLNENKHARVHVTTWIDGLMTR